MTLSVYSPERFMREALKEAEKAFELGEVPVGAVVVSNNRIIARAHNQVE
jgi:tRNA(adenine34) deaminase